MWRRLKIWNFLGKILFLNIFLLRKWVSKIFKATFFGFNLLNIYAWIEIILMLWSVVGPELVTSARTVILELQLFLVWPDTLADFTTDWLSGQSELTQVFIGAVACLMWPLSSSLVTNLLTSPESDELKWNRFKHTDNEMIQVI